MRSSFLLLISFAASAWAAPPGRVELAYELSRNGMAIAEVVYVLEHDGTSYRITETTRGRGILALRGTIRRTSRGGVTPQGLKPEEFTDERTGRQTARARFDWEAKVLTKQYKGEPASEPLPPRAHDRLAFVFDFAFASGRRGEVEFNLFDGRGQSRHVYTPGPRARIRTPLGEFDAVSFVRDQGKERTEIWLASDKSLLPLRILVSEDDGARYEQLITRISAP
jgi:hypothetical protein